MNVIIQPTSYNLPNGARINGVEHIYQTSKPTTRVDGSALVASDRWWKTNDGTEWFWNGTYWLSSFRFRTWTGRLSASATAAVSLTAGSTLPADFFVHSISLSTSGVHTLTDHYTFEFGYGALASPASYFSNSLISTESFPNTAEYVIAINQFNGGIVGNGRNHQTMRFNIVKVGTPSTLLYSVEYLYSHVFL
jgi:hypothetical protein